MDDSTNNTTTAISSVVANTSLYGNRIKFIVLLVLQLVSISCYLYIFYKFYRKRQLRESNHHHVIILLLISSFLFVIIPLPMTEAYMFTSYVFPSNDIFCSIWTWLHYSLNISNLYLMGFASIERNWLIFHPSLVRNKFGLIILHYFPLAVCIIFPPAFYFIAIFVHKCASTYDYSYLLCQWPCYFYNINWASIDLYLNNYVPLLSIPVFCTIIYIRVLIQKRAMKQEVFKWRRDKRIILQLWAVSSLYLAMWMPLQLCAVINAYWDGNFMIQAQIDYMYLMPYMIHLIYPFITLLTHPQLMLHSRVYPTTVTAYPTKR